MSYLSENEIWKGEPSLLILGLDKKSAATLVRQLEQNALSGAKKHQSHN